jgi:hypothetical protein
MRRLLATVRSKPSRGLKILVGILHQRPSKHIALWPLGAVNLTRFGMFSAKNIPHSRKKEVDRVVLPLAHPCPLPNTWTSQTPHHTSSEIFIGFYGSYGKYNQLLVPTRSRIGQRAETDKRARWPHPTSGNGRSPALPIPHQGLYVFSVAVCRPEILCFIALRTIERRAKKSVLSVTPRTHRDEATAQCRIGFQPVS